jgi:NAD(P) transhydrogenase subunit alpha
MREAVPREDLDKAPAGGDRSVDPMRVAIPNEAGEGERRVAVVPQLVSRLTGAGLDVVVESGAGRHAYASDDAYRRAGATVVEADVIDGADAVLTVGPLDPDRARKLRQGAVLVGFLSPSSRLDLVRALSECSVTSFAMELVPRITRAQSMDALSSQALVTGYRAALVAADRSPRFFPLFITAAGTIPPAKVLVLGAGIAGLQAIATARRLGAVVVAYDVREAAAEEVRSLGADFINLRLESLEGEGGYAREMTADRARHQQELLAPYIADADVLITTAAVPGRPAPLLVTSEMIAAMRPGSVVVDLAAESGGNCEPTRPGEEIVYQGVVVWGERNVAAQLPVHASQLYARNVVDLLVLMTQGGEVRPDLEDEVLSACCLTHAGEVRHAPTRALLEETR